MHQKMIYEMTLREIQDAAIEDGFGVLSEEVLLAIREAAERGCLLWTPQHIVLTDRNITILKEEE